MAKTKEKSPEVEINNVKELDEKLADAIQNNENKPSDEEVEEAKEKFENSSKEFAVKTWDIGEPEDAQPNIDYLLHYLRSRVFWTQNGWMGVIKMNDELEDANKKISEKPDNPLKLGYQALEFMFYSLQNPGGVGLEAAVTFEGENEIYAKIFDIIGKRIYEARKELKEIQFLQDQYAAMAQGFYLEVEPEEESEAQENSELPSEEQEEQEKEEKNQEKTE